MQEIHEECGVFGAWSPKPQNLADLAYYGLYALQHRGQESCGIVVSMRTAFSPPTGIWDRWGMCSPVT